MQIKVLQFVDVVIIYGTYYLANLSNTVTYLIVRHLAY